MAAPWNKADVVVICRPTNSIPSRGIWLGDNPMKFLGPVFMFQVALAAFFTGTFNYLLRRFGFSSFFSCLVAAMIISPTFFMDIIFSYHNENMFEFFRYMTNIFFPFLVGLKMDFRMAYGLGQKVVLIGVAVGFLPIIITYLTSFIISWHYYYIIDPNTRVIFCAVSVIGAQTSFHDISCVLGDLKLLNSEVGRLAIASSIISNTCSFVVMIVLIALEQAKDFGLSEQKKVGLYYIGSMAGFIVFIVYVSKPIMYWMMKQVPPGSNDMKEGHVSMVFLMVLICSFVGKVMGHSVGLGPLILGLMVPPGPPIAESIEVKLEYIVSCIFLPIFYVSSVGVNILDNMEKWCMVIVLWLLVLGFVMKIIGTILPAMYSGMSFRDSLVLGLIMASPGVMDVIILRSSLRYNNINDLVYNLSIFFLVLIAGLTSTTVKRMYKPSTDGFTYDRRTLVESLNNTEFRILACVYRDFNVPCIIHFIEALYATDDSPISVYLLHLIKLRRIAPPLIISYTEDDNYSVHCNRSEHIINAFRYFQKQYKKVMTLKPFSALSPCATMHRDICSLVVEKSVDLVVLPFHKQYNVDGIMEVVTTIQNVNNNVLKHSPCPVGILIDRRCMDCDNSSVAQRKCFFHIAVIFLGGVDDREVLSLGMRMVQNPSITLTVIRYSILRNCNDHLEEDEKFDEAFVNHFQNISINMEGIMYREQVAPNGFGIVKAMREIDDKFDLIMVGRQHPNESERFKGLSEWNENPDLGIIGDVLATSKLHEDIPILVLQQKYVLSDV